LRDMSLLAWDKRLEVAPAQSGYLPVSPSRENTLRTSTPPDPSDASSNPRKLDDLDAPGPINTPRIRLRALWTAWSVVVRVHSGALSTRCGGLGQVPACGAPERATVPTAVAHRIATCLLIRHSTACARSAQEPATIQGAVTIRTSGTAYGERTVVRIDHRLPEPGRGGRAAFRITTREQFLPRAHFDRSVREIVNRATAERGRRIYAIELRGQEVMAVLGYHLHDSPGRPLLITALGTRADANAASGQYARSLALVWLLKQYAHAISEHTKRGGYVDMDAANRPDVIAVLVDATCRSRSRERLVALLVALSARLGASQRVSVGFGVFAPSPAKPAFLPPFRPVREAGDRGIEPRARVLETPMLPLHQSPKTPDLQAILVLRGTLAGSCASIHAQVVLGETSGTRPTLRHSGYS
jgi:hypothetical protein